MKKPLPLFPFPSPADFAIVGPEDTMIGNVPPRAALYLTATEGATADDIATYCRQRDIRNGKAPARLPGSGIDGTSIFRPFHVRRPSKANRGAGDVALVSDIEAAEAGHRRMARGERSAARRLASFWSAVDALLGAGYVALPIHAVATAERWTAEEWSLVPDASAELVAVFDADRPADGLAFRSLADAILLPRDRKRRTMVTAEGVSYVVAGPDYGEALGDAFSGLFERVTMPTRAQAANPVARPFALLRRMMHALAGRADRAARKRTIGPIDTLAAAEGAAVHLFEPDAIVAMLHGRKANAAARAVAKRLDVRSRVDRKKRTQGEDRPSTALTDAERIGLARAEQAIRAFIARHHEG